MLLWFDPISLRVRHGFPATLFYERTPTSVETIGGGGAYWPTGSGDAPQ